MSSRDVMRFKAAIRAVAAEDGIPAQIVLQNFMFERLLARIIKAPLRDHLVVKGGYLVSSLVGLAKRTTMDLDATVRNAPLTADNLKRMLEETFAIDVGDGITFVIKGIEPIRDDDVYGGYRVKFIATQESIVVALSADFSTGDVVTPAPREYFLKSRFMDNLSFRVWGYTVETVLAEKVQTILSRGVLNTRPRDFYDVSVVVESCRPDLEVFALALKATCEHRRTLDVLLNPMGTIETIREDGGMRARWKKYQQQYPFAANLSFDAACRTVSNLVEDR